MLVMIKSIDLSQQTFAVDLLTALKCSLKHRRKHVLRSFQLYRDEALTLLGLRCFFVTLRTGGDHFDPPTNSEAKEARTMKLCTVIAYYITSITKQLKFLNSYCSAVCSYCSAVCLIAKIG